MLLDEVEAEAIECDRKRGRLLSAEHDESFLGHHVEVLSALRLLHFSNFARERKTTSKGGVIVH